MIIEEYSPGPYGHVEHIRFERCHIGVSNGSGGHDTGSPGAGLVCHVNPRGPYNQGYHDIAIVDCVFETTDEFTLDFDDRVNADGKHTASDVLIEGCTIKGAGYAGEALRLLDLHRGAGGLRGPRQPHLPRLHQHLQDLQERGPRSRAATADRRGQLSSTSRRTTASTRRTA